MQTVICEECGVKMQHEVLTVVDKNGRKLMIDLCELVETGLKSFDPCPIIACPHCILAYLSQYIIENEVIQ